MKTCLRVTLVFILGALLLVFSERHFLKRYLSYSGDPLTIPLSWYDPVENVSGQKDDDIQVATNNTHTISRTALNSASAFAKSESALSLIVIHQGVIQHEEYWENENRSVRFNPQSMSKTVLAMLTGIAISEGHIESVDDEIGKYILEWREDNRGKITIRQALQMSAGLEQMAQSLELSIFNRAVRHHLGTNFDEMALELKQLDPPGIKYEYNNEVTNILGIVIERATRMRYAEYLSSRIWKPLGLDDASMYLDREGGSVMKSCCILSRPYDWAKLGLLFLNEGVHKEKEIIPSDWIKEMIISSPSSDYYGYQVWLGSSYIPLKPMRLIYDKDDDPPLYLTDDMITFVGFGGQRVWISPKNELVIVYATKKWSNAWNEAKLPNMILQSLQ